MFATGYFATGYFPGGYFPPAGEAARRGGFIPRAIRSRRKRLAGEIDETEARIEQLSQVQQFDMVDLAAIDDAVDRELARLLQLQAEAELALLEQRLADLQRQRRNLMRILEDAFILLISGD